MEIEEQIRNLDRKVTSILTLLKGNDLDQSDTGMAGVVADIDERVKKLEKWKDRFIYLLIGTGLPAGYGISEFIGKLIS